MFRIGCAIVLLGTFAFRAAAAPPTYEGRIKDIRGIDGILTLTVGQDKLAKDMTLSISEARILGTDGAEMKVGDLQPGDRVRVIMTPDGRMVEVIRLLP